MIPPPSPVREALVQKVADRILEIRVAPVTRVAIDGVDGVGKTILADELAAALAPSGRPVVRATVDGFHNARAVRYRLGRGSPEGFFRDSYNYDAVRSHILDPLSPGGSLHYRSAAFDHVTDSPVGVPEQIAEPGSILLFDGIFLHRPELRSYWDFSIFLDADFPVTIRRSAERGAMTSSPDPGAPENRRYVEGQKAYLNTCRPKEAATLTIDNTDLAAPRIVSS